MIEQIGNPLRFEAFYVKDKVGLAGLTPVVDVRRNGSLILSDQTSAEVGGGWYSYTLPAEHVTVEGVYTVTFKTADTTVVQRHLGAWRTVGEGGVEHLNASVAGVGAKADAVQAKTDQLSFSGGDVVATLSGETVSVSAMSEDIVTDIRTGLATSAEVAGIVIPEGADAEAIAAAVFDTLSGDHELLGTFGRLFKTIHDVISASRTVVIPAGDTTGVTGELVR